MSQYNLIDECIIKSIKCGDNPLYSRQSTTEKERLSRLLGVDGARIIDRRLTALKKAGRIEFNTKAKAARKGVKSGWNILES